MEPRIAKLFALIVGAVVATYFTSDAISSFFFLGAFAAYLYSKDEALWLTFYFVLSDGFLGFFNNYEAVVSIIPGLPDVEVGHLYVLGTLIKVIRSGTKVPAPFYGKIMTVLLVYIVFLIAQGYAIGVSPELKAHFRIVKFVLPLTLFYTLPKLFVDDVQYRDAFLMFIPFSFLALAAQVVTVSTGLAPSQLFGVSKPLWFSGLLERGQTYRGFYSTGMVLISTFGAMYYTTVEKSAKLRILFMAVILANFLSAFLSATRGWVLCFAIMLLLHAVLVVKLQVGRIVALSVGGLVLMVGLLQVPPIKKQFMDASDRILTVGLIAKGDVTAGGTLERLDQRAPRVMNKWKDSQLTGWGFSDEFQEYSDSHVGNHNILLHAGIIGVLLMILFLGHFSWTMVSQSMALPSVDVQKGSLLTFPIFLLGWFIIHSSSGQQFQFYGEPGISIPEALFFSFGAFVYADSRRRANA